MNELAGSVAVVTGGTRGIGRAICDELAAAGASVAVVATGEERAAAVAAELPGGSHAGFGCDVSRVEACKDVIGRVEELLGSVSILVNNAGITRDNLLLRMKDEEWQAVLDTNLSGPFYLMRAVSRGMMRRRSGKIINVSSVVGLTGNRGQSNYAAAKAGLIALTKSVAQELAGRGVQVNVVAPGLVETDMTTGLPEDVRDAMLEQVPLGRMGAPEDIAKTVRFLVGPGASYITGQVVVVDGGMVM